MEFFFKRFEINPAVLFNIFTKVWLLISGPIIILLIAKKFTPLEQGYYYTFTSIMLIQMFFEFGLGIVVVQMASHEGVILVARNFNFIDSVGFSRLSSLFKFSITWYIGTGLILATILGTGGFFYFSSKGYHQISWEWPWFLLIIFTSVSLVFIPVISIVEGCNNVTEVYFYRLVQGIINSITIIASICLGAGIFTPAISCVARLVCASFFSLRFFKFFYALSTTTIVEKVSWRKEIWPFQWRVGLSSLSSFIMNLLFTPIMFHYRGPLVAGQMGMTLSLVGTASSLGYSWVQTRVPMFGAMIANREHKKVFKLFKKLATISIAVTGIACFFILIAVTLLKFSQIDIKDRLLSLPSIFIFTLAELFKVIFIVVSLFVRSFKKEPLLRITMLSSILTVFLVWLLGGQYGPIGAGFAYIAVLMLITTPLTFLVLKKFHYENFK